MSTPKHEEPLRGRPPLPKGEAATAQIQLRVTPARKSAYVKAARQSGQTLAEWMFARCDRAAGYQD